MGGKVVECALSAVVHDYKLLLGKRAKSPVFGYWNTPGGKIEWGKDPDVGMATLRELVEETKLVGTLGTVLYKPPSDRPAPDCSKTYRIHMHLVRLDKLVEPQMDPREFSDYGFFDSAAGYHVKGSSFISHPSEGNIHALQKTDHVTDLLVPYLLTEGLIR